MYKILYILIQIISFLFIPVSYEKEIIIKNNDENWNNLKDVINDNQNDKELILRFEDDYYDVNFENVFSSLELMISSDVFFIGNKNGTVFDFMENIIGYNILYLRNKGDTLKFENIIFKNFAVKQLILYSVPLFSIRTTTDNFNLIYTNCTIQDSKAAFISIYATNPKSISSSYSVQIDNCIFK